MPASIWLKVCEYVLHKCVKNVSFAKTRRPEMGIFEFLMLCCFGFSWPFSIAKSLKSKSAKGKSLGFMLLVEVGYVFGITHKILYSCNWVIWAYVFLFLLVGVDIALYFRNAALDRQKDKSNFMV